MRTTHHDRHRCAQNADHLAHNLPFSVLFAEVVCTLGTTQPQTVISPPPKGGNGVIRDPTRRRHAGSQLLVLQTPSITSMEAIPKPAGPVRSARGRRNPGNSEQGRCHGETKLALHESHGSTPGIKLALLTQKGPIWQVLPEQGELCTAAAANKPRMANFVPSTSWMRGQHTQRHTRPHRHEGLQRERGVTAVTTLGKVARNSIASTLNSSPEALKFQRHEFKV